MSTVARVGYHCPFCHSDRPPKQVRRRTMAGNIVWSVLFLILFLGLGGILMSLGSAGNITIALVASAAFTALLLGGLVVADRLCTEWQSRCPHCKRKVD